MLLLYVVIDEHHVTAFPPAKQLVVGRGTI